MKIGDFLSSDQAITKRLSALTTILRKIFGVGFGVVV
jgi:hypothetical protein